MIPKTTSSLVKHAVTVFFLFDTPTHFRFYKFILLYLTRALPYLTVNCSIYRPIIWLHLKKKMRSKKSAGVCWAHKCDIGVIRVNLAIVVVCWICYDFAARSLKGVIRHMGSVHSHASNFSIVCGINSCPRTYTKFSLCPRTYTKFSSFKRHLYCNHKE